MYMHNVRLILNWHVTPSRLLHLSRHFQLNAMCSNKRTLHVGPLYRPPIRFCFTHEATLAAAYNSTKCRSQRSDTCCHQFCSLSTLQAQYVVGSDGIHVADPFSVSVFALLSAYHSSQRGRAGYTRVRRRLATIHAGSR